MRALRTRIDKLRPPEIQKPWISVTQTDVEGIWRRDNDATPLTNEDLTHLADQYNLIKITVHTAPPSTYLER